MKLEGCWGGRFVALNTVSDFGAVSLVHARETDSEEDRLLFVAEQPSAAVISALDSVANAHRAIRAKRVPALVDVLPGDLHAVVLAGQATTDLNQVLSRLATESRSVDHTVGGAFVDLLHEVLTAAHEAEGGPQCLGTMSWRNVLLDDDGDISFIGFGHNFPVTTFGPVAPGLVVAPEISLGAKPSPASDVYVAHAALLSLYRFVDLPPPIQQAANELMANERDVPLATAFDALNGDLLSNDPRKRPQSIAELRERYDEVRAIGEFTHFVSDVSRMTSALSALVAASKSPDTSRELKVSSECRTMTLPNGDVIDLTRRQALRLIIVHLVDAHRKRRGGTSMSEMFVSGWPGESPSTSSQRNRVYVAVSQLRGMGLDGYLLRRDDGYLLDPEIDIAAA